MAGFDIKAIFDIQAGLTEMSAPIPSVLMPQSKPRVVIPRKISDVIQLAQVIQSKDAELGTDSPLALLKWANKLAAIQSALDAQERAEELRDQLDSAYEERDRRIKELLESIRQSRDVLTGIYRQDMSKLTDFGFTVEKNKT
ncbi:MAG: hypothetical protein AAF268_15355 [Cyanobacteria bacterium P01_A01_bin.3]